MTPGRIDSCEVIVMRTPRQIWTGIAAFTAMLVLILDTKTAIAGAREGITLCLVTAIPSLFPFFVLSGLINSCFVGKPIPALRPLGRLCGVQEGGLSRPCLVRAAES